MSGGGTLCRVASAAPRLETESVHESVRPQSLSYHSAVHRRLHGVLEGELHVEATDHCGQLQSVRQQHATQP